MAGRPNGQYTQAKRLLALYDRLHRGERLRPDDVCGDLGVDRRTVFRDLQVLRDVLGDRLTSREGADGRVYHALVRMGRDFPVTERQVLAVAVGARMTGFLSGQSFEPEVKPILDELRQALPAGERGRVERLERRIHVTQAGQKDYRTQPHLQGHLHTMLQALLIGLPVELTYLSHRRRATDQPPRILRVHPQCVVLHRGGLYFVVDVVGGDWRGAPRVLLALDRIDAPTLDRAEPFEPDRRFDPEAWLSGAFGIFGPSPDAPAEQVVIRISPFMAPFVQERLWHHSQTMQPQPDGGLLLTMWVRPSAEIEEWVLGMAEHAQVVGPASLKARVRGRLQAALDGV